MASAVRANVEVRALRRRLMPCLYTLAGVRSNALCLGRWSLAA